jgi:transcriptional regulator with XRE-family HTH domain
MSEFGAWLRQHRKDLGMRQSDVAKRAGVSTSYVSTLERNQKHSVTGADLTPDRDKVLAIAKAVKGDEDEALLLCGYSSELTTKPRNVAELLAAIERLGVDEIQFPRRCRGPSRPGRRQAERHSGISESSDRGRTSAGKT